MSNIFTKTLALIYGSQNDAAVLEGAINFSKAFGTQLVIGVTAEGSRNSASAISDAISNLVNKPTQITLADESYKTAAKMVEDIEADLVVVSNSKHTQSLVDSLKVPVLSILKEFKQGLIKNILMPLHDDPGTRQKIPIATEISKVFGAGIHVLVVTSNNPEEITKLKTYAYQAEKYIHDKGGRCTYQIETGKKVVDETIRVGNSSGADLIIIMNERDGGWFNKARSEQIMSGSTVPVLVVEPKDTTISYAQL